MGASEQRNPDTGPEAAEVLLTSQSWVMDMPPPRNGACVEGRASLFQKISSWGPCWRDNLLPIVNVPKLLKFSLLLRNSPYWPPSHSHVEAGIVSLRTQPPSCDIINGDTEDSWGTQWPQVLKLASG